MSVSLADVWVHVIGTTPKDKRPKWYDQKAVSQVKGYMNQSRKSTVRVLEGYCIADGYATMADIKTENEKDYDAIVERFWKELFRWLDSFSLLPLEAYGQETKLG